MTRKEKIILVHGLYMHGVMMYYMQRKLEACGYDVCVFSYPSVTSKFSKNVEELVQFVHKNKKDGDICHFVGHSLGGLVIRATYEIIPEAFTGNIVTVATPHNGSIVAERVAKHIHAGIIGGAFDNALDGDLPEWQGNINLGVIAGTKSLGLGSIIPNVPKPNDGTVSLEEAKLCNQTDFIEVNLSHTAVIYSHQVIKHVDYFLQHSCFEHTHEKN